MPWVVLGRFRGRKIELKVPGDLYCIATHHCVNDFGWKLAIGDSRVGFNRMSRDSLGDVLCVPLGVNDKRAQRLHQMILCSRHELASVGKS